MKTASFMEKNLTKKHRLDRIADPKSRASTGNRILAHFECERATQLHIHINDHAAAIGGYSNQGFAVEDFKL